MATQARKKISKEDREKCRILTPVFRASYAHVFKPQKMEGSGGDPEYSITMLFPKNADLSGLKRVIKQAKINEWGSEDQWPDEIESPVKDGDGKKNKGKEGYNGHWVIKAKSKMDAKPGIVDATGKRIITEASEFYSGCYARAEIFAYAWTFGGRHGVGFILDNAQFVRDGEKFGGRKNALEAFSPIDADVAGDDADAEEEEEEGSF